MKKKKLRGILGRKKAMRARHGKQTCFFFWPNALMNKLICISRVTVSTSTLTQVLIVTLLIHIYSSVHHIGECMTKLHYLS